MLIGGKEQGVLGFIPLNGETDIGDKLYVFATNVKDSSKYFKSTAINNDDNFPPLLPLKRHVAQYPLMDFVNTVCHILSLDKAASNYAQGWKSNMFKVFGFNEDSPWRSPYSQNLNILREEPCKGELLVVAPEIICTYCNMVRDLDFCRDKHCCKVNDTWCFICPGCDKPYNKDDIETVLAEQLDNLIEAALLQDLRCSKCPYGIIDTVLSSTKYCKKCGNVLDCTRSSSLVEQQVLVYDDLAEYYHFDYLKTVSSWILKGVKKS